MALSGIYKITNKKNDKVYIGQSKDILKRWSEHIEKAYNKKNKDYNNSFQKDLREIGVNNFTFEILKDNIYDKIEADKLEAYYISLYDSYNNGYNKTKGNYSSFEIKQKLKQKWSDEELILLKKLSNEGLSQQEIANRLGRSLQSVNCKLSRLKIGPRTLHPWTTELEQQMLMLRNEKYTQLQASKILGFSKDAVKKRWHDVFSSIEGNWRKRNDAK